MTSKILTGLALTALLAAASAAPAQAKPKCALKKGQKITSTTATYIVINRGTVCWKSTGKRTDIPSNSSSEYAATTAFAEFNGRYMAHASATSVKGIVEPFRVGIIDLKTGKALYSDYTTFGENYLWGGVAALAPGSTGKLAWTLKSDEELVLFAFDGTGVRKLDRCTGCELTEVVTGKAKVVWRHDGEPRTIALS